MKTQTEEPIFLHESHKTQTVKHKTTALGADKQMLQMPETNSRLSEACSSDIVKM